jgi:hypothetical protein
MNNSKMNKKNKKKNKKAAVEPTKANMSIAQLSVDLLRCVTNGVSASNFNIPQDHLKRSKAVDQDLFLDKKIFQVPELERSNVKENDNQTVTSKTGSIKSKDTNNPIPDFDTQRNISDVNIY